MGMLLFDKSGTFVPSDYGLTVGDMLHIVAIGGGGSAGAAGGATSFGNLLTVAGGAAAGSGGYGGEGGWHPALPVTLCSAPPNDVPMGTAMYSNAGGCRSSKTLLSGSAASDTITIFGPFAPLYGGAGYGSSASTDSSAQPITLNGTSQNGYFNGGKGCDGNTHTEASRDDLHLYLGGGGSGYGAGGGGGYATVSNKGSSTAASKNGGAHGVFNWLDYVLTASSPSSFAITIGAGGASGKVSSSGYSDIYYNYGAGASGCVAIYW